MRIWGKADFPDPARPENGLYVAHQDFKDSLLQKIWLQRDQFLRTGVVLYQEKRHGKKLRRMISGRWIFPGWKAFTDKYHTVHDRAYLEERGSAPE